MIFWSLVVAYAISQIVAVFNRSNTQINLKREFVDLLQDSETHNIGEKSVRIAVMAYESNTIGNGNLLANESLFELEIRESLTIFDNSTGIYTSENRILETQVCNETDISYQHRDSDRTTGLLFWPVDKDYKLRGNRNANNSLAMEIVVKKCSNKSYCLTDEEIDNYLNNNDIIFTLVLQLYYVDSNDYDSPLKPYIENELDWRLVPDVHKKIKILLSYNKFSDNKNVFGIGSSSTDDFYSFEKILYDQENDNSTNNLMTIPFTLTNSIITTERQVYTILEVISAIGGFIELIYFSFFYSVSLFTSKQIMSYFLSKLYLIDNSNQHKKKLNRRIHSLNESSFRYPSSARNNDRWAVSESDINLSHNNSK